MVPDLTKAILIEHVTQKLVETAHSSTARANVGPRYNPPVGLDLQKRKTQTCLME